MQEAAFRRPGVTNPGPDPPVIPTERHLSSPLVVLGLEVLDAHNAT
jgi:hypothetical protein